MLYTLRPYQQRALDGLRSEWRNNPILVLATGGGKTVVAAHIINGAVERGKRVLFLAHRRELIAQAAARFLPFVPCGIIQSGFTPTPLAPVQVASVQTLVRRELPPADVVIVDECHHATAKSYKTITEGYPTACLIGLTATPFRLDGTGLRDAGFGAIVVGATAADLIAEGSLLEPRVFQGEVLPDLASVSTRQGDYAAGELAVACDQPRIIADIIESWKTHADDRATVLFAASVEHSKHLCEAFAEAGVVAEHLDGTTPVAERDEILERFREGATRIVANYGVLTEGWDVPAAGVCILARPTKSLGLYLQMVGRVMRPLPGKARPIILDHAECTKRHGWCTQELQYTLDAVEKKAGPAPVKNCPSCFALVAASARVCPECEMSFAADAVESHVPQVDGVMREITKDDSERDWYTAKVNLAASRGNKLGWARHAFKERFGRWPAFYSVEKVHYQPFDEPLTVEHLERVAGEQFAEEFHAACGFDPRSAPVEFKHLAAFAAHLKRSGRVAFFGGGFRATAGFRGSGIGRGGADPWED